MPSIVSPTVRRSSRSSTATTDGRSANRSRIALAILRRAHDRKLERQLGETPRHPRNGAAERVGHRLREGQTPREGESSRSAGLPGQRGADLRLRRLPNPGHVQQPSVRGSLDELGRGPDLESARNLERPLGGEPVRAAKGDELRVDLLLERAELGDSASRPSRRAPAASTRFRIRSRGARAPGRRGRAWRRRPATSARSPRRVRTPAPRTGSCRRARAVPRTAQACRRSRRWLDRSRESLPSTTRTPAGIHEHHDEASLCRTGVASSVPLPWGGLGSVGVSLTVDPSVAKRGRPQTERLRSRLAVAFIRCERHPATSVDRPSAGGRTGARKRRGDARPSTRVLALPRDPGSGARRSRRLLAPRGPVGDPEPRRPGDSIMPAEAVVLVQSSLERSAQSTAAASR